MNEYIVKKETIQELADSVRDKTVSNDSLSTNDIIYRLNNLENSLLESFLRRTAVKANYNNVEKIRNSAFRFFSNLTQADFPNATEIGHYAFSNCDKLITGNFPKVTTIYDNAFYDCNELKSVNCPNVINIFGAFGSCPKLEAVDFPEATSISTYEFLKCYGLKSANIPKLTNIPTGAFSECTSLIAADFPNVTSIGWIGFSECDNLTTINFPNLTGLGGSVFYDCPKLVNVNLPNLESMGQHEFKKDYSLININLPKVKSIGAESFSGCSKLQSIDCPEATSISNTVFYNCSQLTDLNMPKISSISYNAFENCSALTTVDFPLITSVSSATFKNCSSLSGINLPLAKTIAANAFQNCTSLTSAEFPSVEEITGEGVFKGCSSLTTLTFPALKILKGKTTFNDCTSLTSLILSSGTMCIPGSPTTAISSINHFANTPIASGTGNIYVPRFLLDEYKANEYWKTYSSQFLPLNIVYIRDIDKRALQFNSIKHVEVDCFTVDTNPTITITSNNESVVTIGNISQSNDVLTFDINSLSTEGEATITVRIDAEDGSYERTFDVEVFETIPEPIYMIEQVNNATYGFTLASDEYYTSNNTGSSTAAVCKVVFDTKGIYRLSLDCINTGYNQNNDFGIISMIDTTLDTSYFVDSANKTFKSFKGSSSADVQTVDFGIVPEGEHFIYVKYRRTTGTSSSYSLKFKVRMELL